MGDRLVFGLLSDASDASDASDDSRKLLPRMVDVLRRVTAVCLSRGYSRKCKNSDCQTWAELSISLVAAFADSENQTPNKCISVFARKLRTALSVPTTEIRPGHTSGSTNM